ncbi:hypothetical protein BpHYR1_039520 [Brachionus plicatilis]|uniref:Uncharacterized protein n=1 Tax=Brachionus plicatilis TaxID=10195 RepID=A0A3M7R2L2_BRAPC|nr:hypothetical protein BpHYR1_039520 [Brachionus plicatilis]
MSNRRILVIFPYALGNFVKINDYRGIWNACLITPKNKKHKTICLLPYRQKYIKKKSVMTFTYTCDLKATLN